LLTFKFEEGNHRFRAAVGRTLVNVGVTALLPVVGDGGRDCECGTDCDREKHGGGLSKPAAFNVDIDIDIVKLCFLM
jgi:hypothetical protein